MKKNPVDGYLFTDKTICNFKAKKYLNSVIAQNLFVFFIDDNMNVTYKEKPDEIISSVKIDINNMLSFATSEINRICILYKSGLLEVRDLEENSRVLCQYSFPSNKPSKNFPQLYWEAREILVLNEDTLELIDFSKYQRTYKEIIPQNLKSSFQLLFPIKLVEDEKTILLLFNNKIVLYCLPLLLAELPITDVTNVLTLCESFIEKPAEKNSLRPYFIALVIDNKKLEIRNLLNMKTIAMIDYHNKKETIILSKNKSQELLIVTFYSKKKKVKRTFIYKINTKYYYDPSNIFQQKEDFFEFQIPFEEKEPIQIFTPKYVEMQNCEIMLIEITYVKHDDKNESGQVIHFALILGQDAINKNIIGIKYRNPEWKENLKWKEGVLKCLKPINHFSQAKILSEFQSNLQSNLLSSALTLNEPRALALSSSKENKNSQEDDEDGKLDYYSFVKHICDDLTKDDEDKFIFSVKSIFRNFENQENNFDFPLKICHENESNETKSEEKSFQNIESFEKELTNLNNKSLEMLTKSIANEDDLEEINDENQIHSFPHEQHQDHQIEEDNHELICEKNQNEQFNQNVLAISDAITTALNPLKIKLDEMNGRIQKNSENHEAQLRRCQRMIERKEKQCENLDMKIGGYCQEMVGQIDNNLQNGLQSYWNKIEEIDRKSIRNRTKVIADFGIFIDEQLKSREEIFSFNRACLENNLSKVRKRMFNFNQEENVECLKQDDLLGKNEKETNSMAKKR